MVERRDDGTHYGMRSPNGLIKVTGLNASLQLRTFDAPPAGP